MLKRIASLSLVVCTSLSAAQYVAEVLPTPTGVGSASGAGGGQLVGDALSGLGGWPCVWDVDDRKFVSLLPSGYDYAQVFGVGGGKQVGHGFVNNDTRALLWEGTSESVIDLHPAGYLGSIAYGTDGATQVGAAASIVNQSHASLWSGTANSFTDLHPSGYSWSEAYDVAEGVQVGVAENVPVLWRGTAVSMVELPKPAGATIGSVGGIHGSQAVGFLNGLGAMIWDIDDWTYTVLGPGVSLDTNGTYQVGSLGPAFKEHAVRWTGSESSRLDLHDFLPVGFTRSFATGIDESGLIVGYGSLTGVGTVPLVWSPVPEPTTCLTLGAGFLVLLLRRRRK